MKVGKLIKVYRAFHEQDLRSLSKEMGISSATLCRIENGNTVDGKTLVKLIRWLFE